VQRFVSLFITYGTQARGAYVGRFGAEQLLSEGILRALTWPCQKKVRGSKSEEGGKVF
jgi:hypothetical protein